jgi:hypothetical protein
MTWTLTDDEPNINVRAIINPLTQVQELEALISALQKRLPKEKPDVRPLGNAGAQESPKEIPAYQLSEAERAARDRG